MTLIPVPSPAFITAALFCPDCEDWHSVRVIIDAGRLPNAIAVGIGPGRGWWYRLTDEDRGTLEGLSVPVYRATSSIADAIAAYPPAARGAEN